MYKFIYSILTCLFFSFSLNSLSGEEASLELRQKLFQAQPGDYLITYQNKAFTLMHIRSKKGTQLVIEEVSVPERYRKKYALTWPEWIAKGAPRHTSWVAYEVELESGLIQEYYSYTKQGWADIAHSDNFLSSLLNLNLEKVPVSQRKRAGRTSISGPDRRPLWAPQVIVNGERVPKVPFDAWKTKWPADGSELAGKTVEVYLPSESGPYPGYFPYWIQVKKGPIVAKLRVVDSGFNLQSPQQEIPRRPPEFVDSGSLHDEHLLLRLKTRPYYKTFDLYAVDIEAPSESPIKLKHSIQETKEKALIHLWVDQETLSESLMAGTRYYFYAVPVDYADIFSRTSEPYLHK